MRPIAWYRSSNISWRAIPSTPPWPDMGELLPRHESEAPANIAQLLELRAAERPFQRAVVFPEGRDAQGRTAWTHLTFRALNELTDEFARGLVARGVAPGD